MTVVALEQLSPRPGLVRQNSDEITERAAHRLGTGADIVVFPELANSGYVLTRELISDVAQPVDGPFVEQLVGVTSRHGGLVASGFCERDGDSFFNSVVVVDANGPILTYRKLHLFDEEKNVFDAGDDLPVVDTVFGSIGVCICYDLRFVEVMRILALRGADIVLAPAAWVGGFDAAVPEEGLTKQAHGVVVQANLNQVAVVAVSQVSGPDHGKPRMLGGSLAVDAFGDILSGPLSRAEPDSATATFDIAAGRRAQVRSDRIRPRADRRLDVYELHYGKEIL